MTLYCVSIFIDKLPRIEIRQQALKTVSVITAFNVVCVFSFFVSEYVGG